jgi:fructose-1,6-bisphosphatase/sedoheptulose 1,7-bisphosphatase-like protein
MVNSAVLEACEKRILDGNVTPEDHATVIASAEVKIVMISRGFPNVVISQAEAKCLGAELWMLRLQPKPSSFGNGVKGLLRGSGASTG